MSIGPGVTQFTRMFVVANSLPSAFENAITPALAAEYTGMFSSPSSSERPHVDDPPLTDPLHVREHLRAHLQNAEQVGADDLLPVSPVMVLEGAIAAEVTGAVHENVHASVLAQDLLQGRCDLLAISDIDPN